MSSFDAVVDAVREEGASLRQQLADQAPEQESPAVRDAKDAENAKRQEKQVDLLQKIADNLAGGSNVSASTEGETGGFLAGIGGAIKSVGGGLGKAIGGFMKGVAAASVVSGKFVVAMTALGAGIGAFFGLGTVLIRTASELLPGLMENLKSLEELDGKKLTEVGKGLSSIGVGLGASGMGAAFAAGGMFAASIIENVREFFGMDTTMDALVKSVEAFGSKEIVAPHIEKNSKALSAYGTAMAKGGIGSLFTAVGSVTNLATTGIDGITKLIGGKTLIEKLEEFGAKDVDPNGYVESNAKAMGAYAMAMTKGAGGTVMEAIGSFAGLVAGVFDKFTTAIGGKTQLEKLFEFGKKKVNLENVTNNAKAMAAYASAMNAKVLGAPGEVLGAVGGAITQAVDGLVTFFGGKTSIEDTLSKLQKFGNVTITDAELKNIKNNAEAMVTYSGAMSAAGVAAGVAGTAKGIGDFIEGTLGSIGKLALLLAEDPKAKKSPLDRVKDFGDYEGINAKGVENNAEALGVFSRAMAKAKTIEAGGNFTKLLGDIASGIGSFFGGDKDIFEPIKKFSNLGLDSVKAQSQADAITQISKAFNTMPVDTNTDRAKTFGKNLNFISKSVGVFNKARFDPKVIAELADTLLVHTPEIDKGADALNKFARALNNYSSLAQTAGFRKTMTDFAEGMDIVGKVIEGGEIDREGVGTGDIDLIGLKKLDIEGAVEKIKSLKKILGIQNAPPVRPNPTEGAASQTAVANVVTDQSDKSKTEHYHAAAVPIGNFNYDFLLE
tara:strand:+ start:458 stop:2794 length:2337 start_codon:yes stop_codon:yes gene_type:complete